MNTAESTDGANFSEIKTAYKYTEDTRMDQFDERLPKSERAKILKQEDQKNQEVRQFEQAGGPHTIEGFYMEPAVPF